MTNYKLLLSFISREWYFWGNITLFHFFFYNMITSFLTWKTSILYYFWLFRLVSPPYHCPSRFVPTVWTGEQGRTWLFVKKIECMNIFPATLRTRPVLGQKAKKWSRSFSIILIYAVHPRCYADNATLCPGKPRFRPRHRRQSPNVNRCLYDEPRKYDGKASVLQSRGQQGVSVSPPLIHPTVITHVQWRDGSCSYGDAPE